MGIPGRSILGVGYLCLMLFRGVGFLWSMSRVKEYLGIGDPGVVGYFGVGDPGGIP